MIPWEADRAALFRHGNYGRFVHWGLYPHLGGRWNGQTFYGVGEWKHITQVDRWEEDGRA